MQLVITGADMITSVAAGRQANFNAFCQGISGNKPLQAFDRSRYRLQRAYEIDDRESGQPDVPRRATRWLCRSVCAAIQEAGLTSDSTDRVAILVGTGLRELRSLELAWADGVPFHISELHFGPALHQATALQGPIMTLSNACAASNVALGLAADLIELGEIDVAIVAGCDSITETMFGTFDRVTLESSGHVVPFDCQRKEVVMGEGAAAVVLESRARAVRRGVQPLAIVRSVAINCDAYHETAPAVQGISDAIADAHRRANVAPADIDLIMAHGTGTKLNDQAEALAIKQVFGASAERVLLSGIKSMTGHTSGASGLVGVAAAIEAMRQERVPPTVGFSTPMPEAEGLDIVVGQARQAQMRFAQVNAFGFGGLNAVIILEKATA